MGDLRIIAGPTGAGKSALALDLAAATGARILSADSRQVYRGFDIGTAKPTAAEQARVPHAGIDLADPHERWSAARWAAAAADWIAEDARVGRPSLIVGGTGLWMQALVRPLADVPPLDPSARTALHRELGALDTPTLRERVGRVDPARAHLGRAQLLRALEVATLTGTPLSAWHARGSARGGHGARWLVVDPGPVLEARLDRRRLAMLDAGWVEEVQALAARIADDAPAWNACGYRELRDVVAGTRSLEDALAAVRLATRRYAKRQRTWFRNQLDDVGPVTRLDPTVPGAGAVAFRWFHEADA